MESVTPVEEEEESSAIAALGSLFKLTEVYLSDFTSSQMQNEKLFFESARSSQNSDVHKNASPLHEFVSLSEDFELARKMNELGLPISFQTNKEKRSRKVQGKVKDRKKKNLWSCENSRSEVLNSLQEQKLEGEYNCSLHGNSNNASSCTPILGQSESPSCYIVNGGGESLNSSHAYCAGIHRLDISLDNTEDTVSTCEKAQLVKDVEVLVGSSLECGNHTENFPINNSADSELNGHCGGNPLNWEQVESVAMQTAEHHSEDERLYNDTSDELNNCSTTNNNCEGTIGDWTFYWDNDYGRNYFYNIVTLQCTWDPPSGMEDLVFTNFTNKKQETPLEMVDLDVIELKETDNLKTSLSVQFDLDIAAEFRDNVFLDNPLNELEGAGQSAENLCCLSSTIKKKRVRKTKFKGKFPAESQELQLEINEEISPSVNKYWCQRYLLFNKYDEGIKMDEEGWFSVTPEAIAKHHALRCGSGTIVDLFTGVGGNSIQFAKRSKHVIAIDIDPKRISLAQYNASIYGVHDQIDFIRGDSFVLAPKLKADVVFMSPPWGGPDYLKETTFDMKTMLRPHDGNFLFSIGREIASKVVMFLPRNVDINQLAELSLYANPQWSLEVEKNYLNGKLKAVTAYFCKPS